MRTGILYQKHYYNSSDNFKIVQSLYLSFFKTYAIQFFNNFILVRETCNENCKVDYIARRTQ